MEAEDKVKNELLDLLENYAQSYRDKNLEGILKLFIEDDDLVVIGTGYDEWVNGKNELHAGFSRDIDQADSVNVKFRNVTISAAGEVAWISCHMNMEAVVNSQEIFLPGRLSVVLEKRNGKWLFAHLHYSLPAAEQEEGKSWPEI
jgi:ketosteroid isomerase-like protein